MGYLEKGTIFTSVLKVNTTPWYAKRSYGRVRAYASYESSVVALEEKMADKIAFF